MIKETSEKEMRVYVFSADEKKEEFRDAFAFIQAIHTAQEEKRIVETKMGFFSQEINNK